MELLREEGKISVNENKGKIWIKRGKNANDEGNHGLSNSSVA